MTTKQRATTTTKITTKITTTITTTTTSIQLPIQVLDHFLSDASLEETAAAVAAIDAIVLAQNSCPHRLYMEQVRAGCDLQHRETIHLIPTHLTGYRYGQGATCNTEKP